MNVISQVGWDFGSASDRFISNMVDFAPGIIGAILVIIAGYLVSKFISKIIVKFLEKIGFEKLCERIKLTGAFKKVGFKSVSSLIGIFVFWVLFIMFIGWGLELVKVPQLIPILASISGIIIRILVAFVVVVVGIAVAELLIQTLKKIIEKTGVEKYFAPADKVIEKSGFKLFDFFYLSIRAFIILFFVQGAFQVLNVAFLSDIIEPILLYIPRVIVAIFVVLLGMLVAEFVVNLVDKILTSIDFNTFVQPIEKTINKEGLIFKILKLVIRIFVLIFFLEIAFNILGVLLLIEFLNMVLLWMPKLVVALAIVIGAWWFASWTTEKLGKWVDENKIPFSDLITSGVKYALIAIGVLIALDQIGVEIHLLNAIFSLAVIVLLIPVGVALSFGFKDYGVDLGVGLKLKRIASVGDVLVSPEVEGEIVEIGNLSTTMKTKEGEVIVSNSALRNVKIIRKKGKK